MTLNNILSDVINYLTSNEKFQSFFLSDIKSLNQYKSVWDENKIRIGLIGITSSGKSTLINALLGEKLLPQKVKPSSSVLVVCKYSTVQEAVIYFDDNSNKDKLTIRKDISSELEKYGDEEFNPYNIEQVKEIHLYSPNFKLSENISLVDSPGLDAYGMEAHEKITLQLALPTLDMILYLTTVKASSDKENLNRIDEITLDSKPLIIVQNMIDSIVPKVIKGGIEDKSVGEIQEENYNRIKKLLKKAAKKSTQEAEILQLSAYDALYNKHKDSHIEGLIDTIDKKKLFLQERQQSIQVNQLIKKLSDISINIKDIDSNGDVYQDKLNHLNKEYDIIKEYRKIYILNSETITEAFSVKTKNITVQIKKLNEMDVSKVKTQLGEYKKSKTQNEEKLSARIKKAQTNLSSLAKQNNITDKDLNFKPSLSLINIIQPSTRSKTVGSKGWKPTKTVVGKIKRGLGSIFGQGEWGKEWVDNTKTTTYFDKEKLINDIEKDKKLWNEWFIKSSDNFDKYMTEGLKKVEDELSLQVSSIKEKQSASISNNELENIQSKINIYLQELKKLSTNKNDNINTEATQEILNTNNQEVVLEVPSIALNLLKLSHHNSYHEIYAIRDFCIESIQKLKIIIWGWGNEDIENFVNLYYDTTAPFPENNFYTFKRYNNILIELYDENNYIQHRDKKQLKILESSSVGVFINANISQSGLFEKQFMNSKLNSFSNCKAVWVIHGMDILLNANTFIEALINLEYFLGSIKRESDLIIVSHKDSFYSLLIYELRKLNFIGTRLESDSREIIENIGKNREDELGSYVKEYLDKKGIRYA
jgi:predicted GTPase